MEKQSRYIKNMKTVLCLFLLISCLSVIAAAETQAIEKDVIESDEIFNNNEEENVDDVNIKEEENLGRQEEDIDTDECDYDTDIVDIDYDIVTFLDMIEQKIYERLHNAEKSFVQENNEENDDEDENQVNDSENVSFKSESSSSYMSDSDESESNVEDSESDTQNYESNDFNKITDIKNTKRENDNSNLDQSTATIENKKGINESEIEDAENSKSETIKTTKNNIQDIENSDTDGIKSEYSGNSENISENKLTDVQKTESKMKFSGSESTHEETVIKSSDTLHRKKTAMVSKKIPNISENVDKLESTAGYSKSEIKHSKSSLENLNKDIFVNFKCKTDSIKDLANNQSEADDNNFNIDFYDKLLNSDIEKFTDFIDVDEDAYSVVDITLPRDTQFEMVKYEKVQNGRKVVLMKLVPVGFTAAEETDHSENDNLESESNDVDDVKEKKALIISVKDTNTVLKKSSINNVDIGTKATHGKSLSSKENNVNESKSNKNSQKVTDGTYLKPNEEITFSDTKEVSDDNIADDADDSEQNNGFNEFEELSMTVKDNDNSQSEAAEDNGAKWCICYSKLSDIPWVVRMQMGV